MNDLDFSELDSFTEKMWDKVNRDYPEKAEKVVKKCVYRAKNVAKNNTPVRKYGQSTRTKDKWVGSVKKRSNKTLGIVKLRSRKGHLIEHGHIDADTGAFVEGAHMLERTMTGEQPKIDRDIEKMVDDIFNL